MTSRPCSPNSATIRWPPSRPRPSPPRATGPRPADVQALPAALAYHSWAPPSPAAAPASIQNEEPDLPAGRSEPDVLADLRDLASQNVMRTQLIGQGYFDTITPAV